MEDHIRNIFEFSIFIFLNNHNSDFIVANIFDLDIDLIIILT